MTTKPPPRVEDTPNYKALDRPVARGVRTPFEWPPKAYASVTAHQVREEFKARGKRCGKF